MWTRQEVKYDAKRLLSRCYLAAFLVSLIYALLSGGLTNGSGGGAARQEMTYQYDGEDLEDTLENQVDRIFSFMEGEHGWEAISGIFSRIAGMGLGLLILGFGLMLSLLSLAIKILVTNPMEVGANRFFMCSRERDTKIGTILYAFSCGSYWNVVKILLLRDIKIFLWSLLLVIPGIVKSYEYQMVSYVLAENPALSTGDAFALSKDMTDGEKMNLFVLDLSFIPWIILSAVTCGLVGVFWVNPYTMATKAEVYGVFRKRLLDMGRTNAYVLPGF